MSSSSEKKDATKRPSNSYSLLSLTMSEVQKSKKPVTSSVKKSSSSGISSSFSLAKEKERKNENSSRDKERENENSSSSTREAAQDFDRDPNVPDRSYGDYFCPICDSHMNSDAMWEAHVTGKRHIKNIKKGDTDTKYEDLDDVESNVKYELRNVKDPIIGLSYIQEIRRREPNVPPIYNCFLCHASIATVPLVVEHVISLKHRLNYIKENSPEEFQLLDATNLRKGSMEPLVHEAAIKLEQQDGRGTVKVKQEKKKAPVTTWKRTVDPDDELPKIPKTDKMSIWKSVDAPKEFRRHERSRSRSRSLSPRDRRRKLSPADDYYRNGYKKSRRDVSPMQGSYGRSHSRKSERDEFSRKYDVPGYSKSDYPHATKIDYLHTSKNDYLPRDSHSRKSDSTSRPFDLRQKLTYNLSPPPDPIRPYFKEQEKRMYPSAEEPAKNLYPSTSASSEFSQQSRQTFPSEDRSLLPHEKAFSDADHLKDFLQTVLAFPIDILLKIVLNKLENVSLKGIGELILVSKVINQCQAILCKELPAEVISHIKQKVEGSVQNTIIPGLDAAAGSNLLFNRPSTEASFTAPELSRSQSNLQFLTDILNDVKRVQPTAGGTQKQQSPPNLFQSSAAASYSSAPVSTYSTAPTNTYSTAPANSYQTPPVNSYSANSYTSQGASGYINNQLPSTNAPYPSSAQSQNFPPGNMQSGASSSIPGLGLSNQMGAARPPFNYQQFTPSSVPYSTTSQYSSNASKNFLSKF